VTALLAEWLAGRSPRERRLLALLVAAALPLGAAFSVVAPLAEGRDDARRELAEARALHEWVAGQDRQHAASLRRQPRAGAAERPTGPTGVSGIERSLRAAGLGAAVTRLTEAGDGSVSLGFEAVAFVDLVEWLDAESPVWGYAMVSFRIARGEVPGEVAADLALEPGP